MEESKKKVLVIDDIAPNRKLIYAYLKKHPYEVFEQENGKTGLAFLLENYKKIDIVLLDISMPDMSGIEVCREFRNSTSQEKKRMPIIAYTAHATIGEKKTLMESGFDDLLIKPFQKDELMLMLDRWL